MVKLVVDRILLGGQKVTRNAINAFVGTNNYAWQELRPPSVHELTQGVVSIVEFPVKAISGQASKFFSFEKGTRIRYQCF